VDCLKYRSGHLSWYKRTSLIQQVRCPETFLSTQNGETDNTIKYILHTTEPVPNKSIKQKLNKNNIVMNQTTPNKIPTNKKMDYIHILWTRNTTNCQNIQRH
jgi:hypothetical protein